MKRLYLIVIFMLSLAAHAQRPTQPSAVNILVGDSLYELPPVASQSEIKPGWKIVDIKLKDKTIRYLWGKHAKQLTDNKTPTFVIDVRKDVLHDFAIVKLDERKQYRKFPHADVKECRPQRIDLDWMKIELLKDERYRITPISPMEPGEYVIVNLQGKAINEYGDVEVYPFWIKGAKD